MRINLRTVPGGGQVHISSVVGHHQGHKLHPSTLPQYLPPTPNQLAYIKELAMIPNLGRSGMATLLDRRFPDHPLEPRQISNAITKARAGVRDVSLGLGSDAQSLVDRLGRLQLEDPGWVYSLYLDPETSRLRRLFWMSPAQVSATQRFPDILIGDITANRNRFRMPLNLLVGVDQFAKSRTFAYILQDSEDTESHSWALERYLEVVGMPPDIFVSDQDFALGAAVVEVFPDASHILCLHHLSGNILKNLAGKLGASTKPFLTQFWSVYYSMSPEQFDTQWDALLDEFPAAREYLSERLYPTREQWAFAWVATKFTLGIHTNGRIEKENGVSKALSDLNTSLLQCFEHLNQRSQEQVSQDAL
jgi:hypothetical protein